MYILFKFAVCLFAAYGLITLILAAAEWIRGGVPLKHPGVRMVLLVKDAEEQIEYIVRNAVKNDITSSVLSDNSLVVVDMDSKDNTFLLLEKLQKDYSNVETLKFEDRALIFEDPPIFSLPSK